MKWVEKNERKYLSTSNNKQIIHLKQHLKNILEKS